MCSMCRSYPCRSGCPNDYGGKTVGECASCGEDVYIGQEVVEIHGELYHKDCVIEMGIKEVADLLDIGVMDLLDAFDINAKEAEAEYV